LPEGLNEAGNGLVLCGGHPRFALGESLEVHGAVSCGLGGTKRN
jgi:hypothetical protein